MPFGRLHEEAAGEDKLLILSDAAWRMWGMGLIYCQKNLTDGFIDERAIELWGVKAPSRRRIADELCAEQVKGRAPLWERVGGGFQVHDYLQWNDSKEDILSARANGRERIRRFREREREERERERVESERLRALVAERTPDINALLDDEPLAHNVVRGSGDLKEEKGVARFAPAHHNAGAMAGALPREHLKHAACDPTFSLCVPEAVHAKLLSKLAPKHNGDRMAAGAALHVWYPKVWQSLEAGYVMGDEFKFWQGQFDAAFASHNPAASTRLNEPKSTVPGADRTAEYLRRQREA